jgi:hypothetical protein
VLTLCLSLGTIRTQCHENYDSASLFDNSLLTSHVIARKSFQHGAFPGLSRCVPVPWKTSRALPETCWTIAPSRLNFSFHSGATGADTMFIVGGFTTLVTFGNLVRNREESRSCGANCVDDLP